MLFVILVDDCIKLLVFFVVFVIVFDLELVIFLLWRSVILLLKFFFLVGVLIFIKVLRFFKMLFGEGDFCFCVWSCCNVWILL